MTTTRRRFLQTVGAVSLGLPEMPVLRQLVAADEGPLRPEMIQFSPDVEPLVRLIEATPRDKCVEVLAEELRQGLSYRRFLTGVFLAFLRRYNAHHGVFMMHSVYQVCLDLHADDQLLPLFWAVDQFKDTQPYETDVRVPLKGPFPAAEQAQAGFDAAMRRADREGAEHALVALARGQGARQAMEHLWRYACRDGGLIGHRAIAVASCGRVLDTVGWRHAEPVLRFVVVSLLERGGGEDRSYRPNLARADKHLAALPAGWTAGRANRAATLELLGLMREGKPEPACELAMKVLAGPGAQAVWDAVHLGAAELMVRHQPFGGIVGRPLHANTSANALHHAFAASLAPRTRLMNVLQAVAWVADFTAGVKGSLRELTITGLQGEPVAAKPEQAVAGLFEALPMWTWKYDRATRTDHSTQADRATQDRVCRQVVGVMRQYPEAIPLYLHAARGWLCRKATDNAHEYKFPPAIFEEVERVSPEWRPHLLAASVHYLHGKQNPDAEVIVRAREALGKR